MSYHEHLCGICEETDGCKLTKCPEEYTCDGCREDFRQLGNGPRNLIEILFKRTQRLEAQKEQSEKEIHE